MAIHIRCAACDAHLQVRDEHAGKQGKCPRCGKVLKVPAPAVPPPAEPPEIPAAAMRTPPSPLPPVAPPAPTVDAVAPVAEPAPSAAVIDVDSAAPLAPRKPARRRSSRIHPAWVGTGLLVLVALSIGTFVAWRAAHVAPRPPDRTAHDAASQPGQDSLARSNPAPFNPLSADMAADTAKPAPGAPLEDIIAFVKHGIVKIETSDSLNNRRGLGSGFVIDVAGLVATNYHVLSDAAKADVVFNDGTRYGVEGYLAVDHRSDLAIIKLNGVPTNVRALELNYGDGPRDAAQVYAIGHPHDNEFTTTGGIVGRVLHTRQLPAETRQWLEATLDDADEDLWIQHDAKIAPGNSGGPLINARGEVVGVNSWVNQKLGMGYAIHARHLHELTRHQETAVVPLKLRRRSLPEPVAPQFAELPAASERIKKLCAELSAKGWRPQVDDDWQAFDELARTITTIKYVQAQPGIQIPMPAEVQQAVVRDADDAVAVLRSVAWHGADLMRSINAHAGKDRSPYSGAFVFGRVEKLFQGDDAETALLIELIGSEQRYFLPLDQPIAGLAEGDCVLVLGIAHPKSVRVGDNPLKPDQVPILLSKVVLPVTKP